MTLFIEGHSCSYELQRIVQMFFPGEKVAVVPSCTGPKQKPYVEAVLSGGKAAVLWVPEHGEPLTAPARGITQDAPKYEIEHLLGVMLYSLLSKATGLRPQWGVLTGIRPVRLLLSKMQQGLSGDALHADFVEHYLVSESRFSLALQTAEAENRILQRSTPDSFSLYVSIPFCPTRCAYCSFVSQTVERAAKYIPEYVEKLCEELRYIAAIASDLGLKLRTVYFGGGTPTTLDAQQLARLMDVIGQAFDLSDIWEYTVEAGRPDTITADKLYAIKNGGAKRISINPQTLDDRVLQAIGRRHTTAQLMQAYALARQVGFDCINMDLIAGLPTDTQEGFQNSLDQVVKMAPENITVHTLTVKRAADMTFERAKEQFGLVTGMVDYARETVIAGGWQPYYLYRQAGSLSALENVGYAKPGSEGLYNVYIMDETHSIFAAGAGASTKLKRQETGLLKRVFNYKYPYEYISQFPEVLRRKDLIRAFYQGD